MKKYLFKFLVVLSLLLGVDVKAQSSVCGYSTCVPVLPFDNIDNMQIYGAILSTRSGTAVISSGSVVVTNTVAVSGQMGQFLNKVHYSIPSTTVAYTAGQVVGGNFGISDLSRVFPLPVEIVDVAIIDKSGQTPNMILDIIQYPFSTFSDHTTLDLTGNQDKYIGSVLILASDWVVSSGISRLSLSDIGIVLNGVEWTAVLTTLDNVTYSNATSLNVKIGVKQN